MGHGSSDLWRGAHANLIEYDFSTILLGTVKELLVYHPVIRDLVRPEKSGGGARPYGIARGRVNIFTTVITFFYIHIFLCIFFFFYIFVISTATRIFTMLRARARVNPPPWRGRFNDGSRETRVNDEKETQ